MKTKKQSYYSFITINECIDFLKSVGLSNVESARIELNKKYSFCFKRHIVLYDPNNILSHTKK